MPKVGGKSFPYTKKGIAASKVAAKKDDDKKKPKPKKSQVSDEEIMPKKFPKPKGNRRRLLDATNRMNEAAGY